jgi:uncharacterized damage-inducible protein DinB
MAYLRQLFNSGTDPNSFARNISSSAQRRGRDVVPAFHFRPDGARTVRVTDGLLGVCRQNLLVCSVGVLGPRLLESVPELEIGENHRMREELVRLEQQMRRTFEGDAWHGPAVLESLAGISFEEAAAHPIPGAHSIWEIVLHLAVTYRLVLQRIEGRSGDLQPEEDWPAVVAPESERWLEDIGDLRRLNQKVRLAILAFSADRLDEPLAPGHSTAYVHFAGLLQHDAYHAGQISLLRKARTGRKETAW